MVRPLTHSEFMAKVNHDIGNGKKKVDEAEKYLQMRGAEINRKHAMHRKRSGR
jgi:hypothetical protein